MSKNATMNKFSTLLMKSTNEPQNLLAHFQLLGHINAYRLQYPQLVVKYGDILINAYNPLKTLYFSPFSFMMTLYNVISPNPIREHIFDIIEQTCYAAIQCHRYQLRNDCIYILESLLPKGSVRVAFLRGQIYESAERYDDAVLLYKKIIKNNSSTQYTIRSKQRIIAIFREFNQYDKALSDLILFTQMYSDNFDGWYELYNLYTHLGDYSKAILTSNQLILLQPENYMVYIYSADVMLRYAIELTPASGKSNHKNHTLELSDCDSTQNNIIRHGLVNSLQSDQSNTTTKHHHNDSMTVNNNSKKNNDNNAHKNQSRMSLLRAQFKNSKLSLSSTTSTPTDTNLNNTININNSTKPTMNKSKYPVLNDSIKVIYDHLINSRYLYCTSFHLNQHSLSAMGIISTSNKINNLLEKYPDLIEYTSTHNTLTPISSSQALTSLSKQQQQQQQLAQKNQLNQQLPPLPTLAQVRNDSNDLIAMASDYISRVMSEKSVQRLEFDNERQRANNQRGDGIRELTNDTIRAFDPIVSTIYFGTVNYNAMATSGDHNSDNNNNNNHQTENCDDNKIAQNMTKNIKNDKVSTKSKKQD